MRPRGLLRGPRRASQADVAETLDIATGTVSEHLRRIEATVFSEYVLDTVAEARQNR